MRRREGDGNLHSVGEIGCDLGSSFFYFFCVSV